MKQYIAYCKQAIKEACIKANPEIEKCAYCVNELAHGMEVHKKSPLRVNARPIRLADVLLVLENKLHKAGVITKEPYYKSFGEAIAHWNLRKDDLNELRDEDLEFIADQLK